MNMNMRGRKPFHFSEKDIERYLRFLIIPVIAVILIAVVVIADRSGRQQGESEVPSEKTETSSDITGGNGETAASSEAGQNTMEAPESTEETISPDNSRYETDFSSYELQKDAVPEINALAKEYYTARSNADAETIYRLYGKTDTEGMEALHASMQKRTAALERYEDITCYTKPGAEDGSYVVYISSKMKFFGVDTLAPSLVRCYVMKNTDGNYYIVEPGSLTEEQKACEESVARSEDVKLLSLQVDTALKAAVASDPKLADLSISLSKSGETAADSGETKGQDTDVSVGQ